ncbi:AbrB/MazE/SpoVT family DNA-binding domain-containing protein [Candidatus Bathyarchaeota archaeon]|nr:AbrB/MazE/SpoVT family DNA-binding domain-containing protein [Candidatus Bathyarchaeota archaeon]
MVELDDRGRLTLPSEVRKNLKITQKVLLLNAGDHVKLIPLPADPFNTLHGALSIEKPFNELREEAERIALKEAEG